ncbi:amine dehydrogenase large subunit [Roseateles koreensis]|uniref:Amine dehydrogenase large subunit n=1 Tax=Roseateles koreensis TaxID=2987526 RepID=A0ABT5KX24_9BURK|nr:amine dehydrogenase large subunit [Roseateles koreensis]MDC8786381.1 amine dehydrogenase large subunit [Roseateles koreensis]
MDFQRRRQGSRGLLAVAAALVAWAGVHAGEVRAAPLTPPQQPPELPLEQLTVAALPAPDAYRLYLSDPTMGHLVDGRLHVIDARGMRYLGLLGTGFAGSSTLSRDRQSILVASTYHSRLQRGTRSDVVEVYGTKDLAFQYEIEIPAKHVQSLPMRTLMGTSNDGRFLFIQNATPATSVSVVDLHARKFVEEIPTPGCYGAIAWPDQARRFSSVCGDGRLATFELDEQGVLKQRSVSEPFFDPDKDPIFAHYQWSGSRLTFVSYRGQVHELDLRGTAPVALKPWGLTDAAAAKQGWRPGGYQLFALDSRSGRLYVGMHDKGSEGSHKNPAKEIWVFDSQTQRRIGRLPGQGAIGMALSHEDKPSLFVLSAMENRLLSFALSERPPLARLLHRSEPVGETPVYMEMQ